MWIAGQDNGRYIITGVRSNAASQIVNVAEFSAESDTALSQFGPWLDVGDTAAQTNLVNFIRGVEGISGMRSRTLGTRKFLLGDTVNSTPAIVGVPSAAYDSLKNDLSYREYRTQYRDRREVVYVGGNDGMLHAFNAGFRNSTGVGYNTGGTGVTAHPLGAELWSYIPNNLLPHLKWLSLPDYQHVFYVDGEIQTFDVNIFTPSGTHPGGWGTILVAGMRLGGGEYTVDGETFRSAYMIFDVTDPEAGPVLLGEVSANDLGFTTSNVDIITYRTPKSSDNASGLTEGVTYDLDYLNGLGLDALIGASDAEIQELYDNIFSPESAVDASSVPDFVSDLITSRATTTDSNVNQWQLLIGTGPTSLNGQSGRSAKLYTLNLNGLVSQPNATTLVPVEFDASISPAITKAFVGGITVKDWNNDFKDDAVYFGLVEDSVIPATVAGDPDTPIRGRLMQAEIDFTSTPVVKAPTQLLTGNGSTDFAFSTRPTAIFDVNSEPWVYAGTGRFMVSGDSVVESSNAYMGLQVTLDASASVNITDLMDVTDLRLFVNPENRALNTVELAEGATTDVLTPIAPNAGGAIRADTLNDYIRESKSGWIRSFNEPAELVAVNSAFVNDSLIVNSYDPNTQGAFAGQCSSPGVSRGYIFDMYSGLPQLGLQELSYSGNTNEEGLAELTPQGVLYSGFASAAVVTFATKTVRRVDTGQTDEDGNAIIEDVKNDDIGTGSEVKDGSESNRQNLDAPEQPAVRRSWREISLDEVN